jgi:hypothetical protein
MGLKDRFTKGAAPRLEDAVGADAPDEPAADEAELIGDDIRGDIRALANQKLRYKMGVRRELKHLPDILAEREAVLNMAAGEYDGAQGLLVVTERRLVFFAKGMTRTRQEDFPYSKLSSLQTKTSMMSGQLTIFVSGNKAHIKSVLPKERVIEIGEYVRGRISDTPESPSLSAPATTSAESPPAERLRSLQSMRDQGLITADEFEAKRAQILADL